ncbi:UTP--glucose-1-phosphate uridylyltransferase GalU [Pullulanibacillus sp. KACC 23026]|uniref:UTP--glucose-1-phosphate uridylyltransferase GalU n=1 Tax=Pullulanibacillus sp. KACC 23026 TaxID=3028315 RepID=UPI0023AFB24B|nr:UTP--glucose-1-phosphate uridylyltransferase GalU [Pullulanibacillus sp. KACC 23026]WEG13567.1 UTP--glucose-1-phosphate uridylyltransferase GalU [Pullulanibacillus sp. KACC 23026]
MTIRKAIIPAAGLGTRFLPATKALPKEMLPIVDTPTIQYIVEEAIASGIEDIIIISGRNKRTIEDHFDKSYELEETLQKKNKHDLLEQVQKVSQLATIHYVRQKEPKGLGDAILCAKSFIGNEPFAVLLGDDIVKSETPCLKQLIDLFNRYHASVVGVQKVADYEVPKYGIIHPKGNLEEDVINIEGFVEKPQPDEAPSNLAIIGRYILRPEIFEILKDIQPDSKGEVQLTDALIKMVKTQAIFAYQFHGERYDLGDKMGFIHATIDYALQRPDFRDSLLDYLKEVIRRETGKTESSQ